MRRQLLLALGALLVAAPGAATELYRCQAPDGALHFAGSPHACRGAVPHALRGRLQGQGTPHAPPAARSQDGSPPRDLAALLLGVPDVAPDWEVVREAPSDPAGDPDLVAWGVVGQRARHYARAIAGTTEVCSIELWSFRTLEQASAALAGFTHPGWRIEREGEILLMARGLRRSPRAAPERGVFAACAGLAARVRARLAAAVRDADAAGGGS